jgi:hypothetical protein
LTPRSGRFRSQRQRGSSSGGPGPPGRLWETEPAAPRAQAAQLKTVCSSWPRPFPVPPSLFNPPCSTRRDQSRGK